MAADARAIIGRQARNLARMTDDLLDAGRVMLGKIELRREPLDLAALVGSVVDTFHSTGRLVDRRTAITLGPVWVNGDATRLEQVVSNLLGNAIKFTSPGDAIAVDVRRAGDEVRLSVSDEGAGISADLLPMVFDLFVQGPQPLERGAGGLGIGLALARRLVDLHGGRIAGHSDGPGRGSRFTVQLPAIDAPVATPVPGPRVHPARRIVIVEDNDDARTSLQLLLVLAGHEVHAAADGVAGLAAILREHPDVALVDIGLPGMDGRTLAREVRARLHGAIRMIAMTGYGQPEEAEGGLAAGFDRYLVKPVDPDVLAEMLLV
jgi:CheY-like chemotaxis protein